MEKATKIGQVSDKKIRGKKVYFQLQKGKKINKNDFNLII